MKVFNQNVPVEFYQAFAELVRKSPLHRKAGTITLFTDWATTELYAAFTPPDASPTKPVGHGSTADSLFVQVLAAIEPRPSAPALPEDVKHPGPGRWWWLCFYDSAKPGGQQFLGVAVVEGWTLRDAIDLTAELGINPGGKIAPVACTRFVPAALWRNRLLAREDVMAAGKDMAAAEA